MSNFIIPNLKLRILELRRIRVVPITNFNTRDKPKLCEILHLYYYSITYLGKKKIVLRVK